MTTATSQDLLCNEQALHWAFQYIGLPWVNGGRGPNEFDCWGFFCFIQAKHYDIHPVDIAVNADYYKDVVKSFERHGERLRWDTTKLPKDGDAVLMAHARYPSHIGVWLDVDGGGVLHCVRGEGVVFSSMQALLNNGWSRMEYYTHVSNR